MISIEVDGFSQEDQNYYYVDALRAASLAGDSDLSIKLYKTEGRIVGHVRPQSDDFRQDVINNILACHRLLGLKCVFSKSLKLSHTISYEVLL